MDNRIIPRVRLMSGRRSVWPKAVAVSLLVSMVSVACGDDNHKSAAGLPGQPNQPAAAAPSAPATPEAPAATPAAGSETASPAAAPQANAAPSAAATPGAAASSAAAGNTSTGAKAASASGAATPKAAASAGPAAGPGAKPGAAPVPGQPTPGQPGPGQPAAGAPGGGGSTAVGVTDNEIKIGMLSELSGPIAVYGQSFPKVAQAFMREKNEAGGIHGRQLKLIVYDDAWDPVRGKAGAKRLVEQDQVVMMCCNHRLETKAALTPYMDEVK